MRLTDIISVKLYDDLGGYSHTAIKDPYPTSLWENFTFQIVSFFSVRIPPIRYFHTHGILNSVSQCHKIKLRKISTCDGNQQIMRRPRSFTMFPQKYLSLHEQCPTDPESDVEDSSVTYPFVSSGKK